MSVITGLVSYWALDEASGNALDAHGSNTLTESGSPLASVAGKVAGARQFESANSENFSIADNADVSVTSDFAFALWFKVGTSVDILIGKDDLGGNREYNFYCNGGVMSAFVFDSVSGSTDLSAGSGFNDSNWHFTIMQYESSDKKVRIYTDDSATGVASTPLTNGPKNAAAAFVLGGLGNTFFINGLMDEVGFWKKVLTPTERTWLYNSGNGRSYADIVAEASSTPLPSGHTTGFWD